MAWKKVQRDLRRIGKYEVLGKIGGGGSGSVYKGRDPDTGARVAIKILKPEVATDPLLLRRFEQEFQATRTLNSPHIVHALAFGQERGIPYLVMEFVDGKDLWDHINTQGRLPEAEAVALFEQVAQGLHQAHEQGMIHRDVKPDNILLLADGRAKLTDFGLVKDLDSTQNLTETASLLGTPNFMAPEQFEDPKRVDRRCDIYALAATLYMAVTGEVPFQAKGYLSTMQKKLNGELTPPRQLVPELSVRFEKAILDALSIHPAQRPASCLDFIKQLTGCGEEQPPPNSVPTGQGESVPEEAPAEQKGQEGRAAVRYPSRLEISCRAIGGERRTRWKAKVKDISAVGIGMQLYRRFEPGAVLLLEFRGPRPTVLSRLLVRVVRVQAQGSGRWLVACRFTGRLSPDDLQALQAAAPPLGRATLRFRAPSPDTGCKEQPGR